MQKKIFLVSAIAILISAAVIRYVWMDRWEAPSACTCKEVFNADSAIAVPAARAMLGNGYYQYTLRVARMHCLEQFSKELSPAAWQDTAGTDWSIGRAFFSRKCP